MTVVESMLQKPGRRQEIAAVICYCGYPLAGAGWLSGLMMYILNKDDDSVRFHAIQSIVFSLFMTIGLLAIGMVAVIMAFIPLAGDLLAVFFGLILGLVVLASLVIWLILIVKAYGGEMYKLPVIGDFAHNRIYDPKR